MIIGITTFFQSQTNYGQLLQAFALQQVLMQQGHYPYIIRYGFHQPLPFSLDLSSPVISFDKLLKDRGYVPKRGTADNRHFDDFRKEHLNFSLGAYNSIDELQGFPPIADCYITGSDQVWAQLLSIENNRTFFLDFGPKWVRRVAYAPSFSMDSYPEELREHLTKNLKRFNGISVREKTGVEICKWAGFDATWVVDPTMLLDGDYYRQLGGEDQTVLPSDYMFVYHVNVKSQDLACWPAFNSYNQQKGIKAIAVHANGENQPDVEFLSGVEYSYPTIQEWIRLIDGSKYVLTTSFHGMIFAILLHKPFFVVLRPESQFAGNDRVLSVLTLLGLQDRIYIDRMDVEQAMTRSIDWDSIDEKVKYLRGESLSFIKTNIVVLNEVDRANNLKQWIEHFEDSIFLYIESQSKTKDQLTSLLWENENLKEQMSLLSRKRRKYKKISNWLAFAIIVIVIIFLFYILNK